MTAFSSASRRTSVRYVCVSFPGFKELGELSGVTACSIEENQETALKVSGSLSVEGAAELDGVDDMVRVYTDSRVAGALDAETVCHGTLLVSMPSRALGSPGGSAEADLSSVLKLLQDALTTDASTIAAGTATVAYARQLIEARGLTVTADDSAHKVAQAHSWEAGTPVLDIVNDCLGWAGFSSATVDAYGGVVLSAYTDASDRPPVAELADDGTGDGYIIGGRELEREHDPASMPNVAIVTLSTAEGEPQTGTARNDDPSSPYSTVSRGREVCTIATFDELAVTPAKKAEELLRSAMRVTDRYEIDALWYPVEIGDAVRIRYGRAGIDAVCTLVKRETDFTALMRTRLTLRRNVDYFEVVGS